MNKPFAVITARAGSKRLPFKNLFPINGKSLVETSILHAKQNGLDCVVTSDSDHILNSAIKNGAEAIRRPHHFSNGDKHFESIRHAVEIAVSTDESKKGSPIVLLQPTSPFRYGNIIKKCIEAHSANPDKVVLSGRTIHYADTSGKSISTDIWDGCVAVFPYNHIAHQEGAILVENEHANMLQVDTDNDYIQACIQGLRTTGFPIPLGKEELSICTNALSPIVKGNKTTLIGRSDGINNDQSNPVAYINHCHGWDGGRADILFVVASKNIRKLGINEELKEVAKKSKVVIIRDFGEKNWVKDNLKTSVEPIILNTAKNQISTGVIASFILWMAGANVETSGFQRGSSRISYCNECFNEALTSQEIAYLELSSKNRTN